MVGARAADAEALDAARLKNVLNKHVLPYWRDWRLRDIGTGWDPQWHQPTDVYETYSDKDFRLGLNAAQTTLAAVAQLAGLRLRK